MSNKWHYIKWFYQKKINRLFSMIVSNLYQDKNRDIDKSIMVAGTARSGTTWLASIIASQFPSRIMFEPFHSLKVNAFLKFHYFQYMRPDEHNNDLFFYCSKIFSGRIKNSWIDREVHSIFPQHRIIKEIRANLFLAWIKVHFPEIPILFIIRHPCAVVQSRIRLDWATDTDIDSFLAQSKLVDDFLIDKINIFYKAKTLEEKHAIIWCITNLVPLRQFGEKNLPLIFYENLCAHPEHELKKIFRIIQSDYRDSIFKHIKKPSITSTKSSAVLTGDNWVGKWQQILTPEQIKNILTVVKRFELDYLYEDSLMPIAKSKAR